MTRKLNISHFLIILLFLCGGTLLARLETMKPLPNTALAEENGTNIIYLPLARKAPLKTVFGAEMTPITDAQGLEMMSNAGASWVRRNGVLWSAVEPLQGGGYDWSVLASLEEDLLRARGNDMEVILIVRGVPEWARVPDYYYACGPISTDALPAFGSFMHALVQRYGGSPYYVKYFEIWNEPDVDPLYVGNGASQWGCMGDIRDTVYYGGQVFATVLQAAYPMVKAANPEAQVVVGGLLLFCNPNDPPVIDPDNECTPAKYLEGILAAGGGNYFDGVSFHSYDYFSTGGTTYPNGIYGNPFWNTGGAGNTLYGDLKPGLVAKAQYLRNLLTTYGAADKFLLNTETALLCGASGAPPGGPGCEPASPFETLKAAYLVQSYAAAIAEGLLANIWYTPLGWRNSGLLNADLTPRPAYHAYVLARDTLKDAAFVREVNEYSGSQIFGYEFHVNARNLWVLWALDGKAHTITLPALPTAAWDELGNPVDFGSGILTIGDLKTVYVDWGP